MAVHGSLAGATIVTTPDVDLTVGTTSPGLATITPGDASEGSHIVTAEKTLLLITTGSSGIPEVDVLGSGSCEALGTWLGIPTDIVDLVGITFLLEALLAGVVEDVNLMLVVEISSANPSIFGDGYSLDATGTLGNLDTLLFLTSGGVPAEDGGLGANLARNGGLALRADTDAHNIISVVVLVVGNVLCSGVNLTAAEELLGV